MNNAFAYIQNWIGMKSLWYLENKLSVASGFWTGANKEFTKPFATGTTISLKKPQRFIPTAGLGFNPQAINRITTPVTIQEPIGVHFDWDSFEQAVYLERSEAEIEKEYLEPAMKALAQEIDSRAAQFAYLNCNNVVGALGTDPATFDAASGAARERLAQLSGVQENDEAYACVSPTIMRKLKASSVAYFNPVRDIEKQWRTGIVGSGDGFEWYESNSLYSHTAGTWAGTVSMSATSVDGATSLALTCTTGDTFKAGDVISISSVNMVNVNTRRKPGATTEKQFVVLADVTGAASAATISISPAIYGPGSQYQNVDALPQSGATLTLFPGTTSPNGKSGTQNLYFTKKAFALVGLSLEKPINIQMSAMERDPDTGIAIRFTRSWDPLLSRMINRFDTAIGFGNLYADECCVRGLGA
jgi:hypothetical protein